MFIKYVGGGEGKGGGRLSVVESRVSCLPSKLTLLGQLFEVRTYWRTRGGVGGAEPHTTEIMVEESDLLIAPKHPVIRSPEKK